MFKYNLILCIFVVSVLNLNTSLADTTWVEEEDVTGVWSVEGSPYILPYAEYMIEVIDTLVIEPGVTVLLRSYFGVDNSVLIAHGTAEDSIKFLPYRGSGFLHLMVLGEDGYVSLEYCYIAFLPDDWAGDYGSVVFDGGSGRISNCYIQRTWYYSVSSHNENSEVNIFDSMCFGFVNIHSGIVDGCVVGAIYAESGTVSNCSSGGIGVNNGGIISQCIIRGGEERFGGDPEVVEYNCFASSDPDTNRIDLEGFSILDRVNANGDSTDRYGNLFQDPLNVGYIDSTWIYPDYCYLTSESPCIDAGDPDAPLDPDSTRADIGPFFFPQANIAVDLDSIVFKGWQAGTDTGAFVTARNIGLDTLGVSFAVSPYDGPFYMYPEIDSLPIYPGSGLEFEICFDPEKQGDYEAVLTLLSNDRDEGLIEIPLFGEALAVEQDGQSIPTEFALNGVFPNPFNPSTSITYSLPQPGNVQLVVYDLAGRLVDRVVDGRRETGRHLVQIDATGWPSGVYITQLESGGRTTVRKIVCMK